MSEARILTARWGKPNSASLATYRADGGYEALDKALGMAPGAVVDEVKKSNLRGRGGAGFATGLKWSFLPKDIRPRYLTVNADESEPGTFKDRYIIEHDPHQLIEGIAIACWANDIHRAYIYIRGEFAKQARILEKALEEAREAGIIGARLLGKKEFDLEVHLHRGAGAYSAGRSRRCSSRWRGRGIPGSSRRSRPWWACGESPPSSTTSRRWPTSPGSSCTAARRSRRWGPASRAA